jgi:hypothetical protein
MPVELVLRIALPREAAKKVASPGAHQDHGHESCHLHLKTTNIFCSIDFLYTFIFSGLIKLLNWGNVVLPYLII